MPAVKFFVCLDLERKPKFFKVPRRMKEFPETGEGGGALFSLESKGGRTEVPRKSSTR